MRKIVFIILSSAVAVSAVALSINKLSANTVYINMGSVYEQFHLSKELNKELEKVFVMRKHILDSLYENLKTQNEKIQQEQNKNLNALEDFKKLQDEYLYKQKTFESENQSALEKCNKEIWEQINRFTEAYGKEMDYDYILGANGQGNIMYGKDKKNVTGELLDYINARYDDKIK